tara:strand:+ start:299 stop:514 length:216 start_codon:yes stop_codon:yes gene_type:complete
MIHWKTKQEMGEGYQYNQDEHNDNEYNSLIVIDEHETNTMRTKYLIRDVWDMDKLLDLKNHLDDIINERKE